MPPRSDGIVWEKPELGVVEFEGIKQNNLVYRGPHGAGVYQDLREEDAAKRYKMFTSSGRKEMAVAFSPDGIHWSPLHFCPQVNPYPVDGTHYNTVWVDELGEHVGFTRLRDKREGGSATMRRRLGAWPPRQVGRTTSKDFLNWSRAVPMMEGLGDNLQIYSMPVFRHGSVYLGLPVIHNQSSDRAWTELAWSADTREWQRVCPGSPLIPNSNPVGSYDWGCAYSSAFPIILENEIRLYYGGSDWLHFGWREGTFCLATLRPDGFAGYRQDSAKRQAVVSTTPTVCTGSALHLSADVQPIGSIQVTLLDGHNEEVLAVSEALEQTVTDAAVKWQDGFSLGRVAGEKLRVQFALNGAKLYSFGFDLKPSA